MVVEEVADGGDALGDGPFAEVPEPQDELGGLIAPLER